MIIQKFSSASLNTKFMLFRAYCRAYCMAVSSGVQCINIFSTSYVLHIIMRFDNCTQQPRRCSASKLFVLNSVSSLPENMRKLHDFLIMVFIAN